MKKAVEIQSKFEVEFQEELDRLMRLREEPAASHTSSLRVDPPDEVVALRNRICPCFGSSGNQPVAGHSAGFAERAGFFEIGDDEESCGRRSVSSDVDVDRPRRFFAERGWIEQVQPIVVILNARYGLRAVRVREASHPGPHRLRLVGTPSELPWSKI